jgi:hypothetical protein
MARRLPRVSDPRAKVTPAGRRRVEAALERRGLLLVQGQAEAPSVADLHAGAPVTTRGYSWDYMPAWRLRDELAARDDVAVVKLLRGRTTLVHRRLWPAVEALARAARAGVLADQATTGRRELLEAIERSPGAPGAALQRGLALSSAELQKRKNDLCAWLCIVGEEQDEADAGHHTHDLAWSPWRAGKVARGVKRVPSVEDATTALLGALEVEGKPPRPATLLPALKVIAPTG